jgi:hypothetical protein
MADQNPAILALLDATSALSRYERDKRVKWMFPQFSMRLYADSEGFHCYAIVETLNAKGQPTRTEIANAVWAPVDVTERLVVSWGARALEAWLSTQVPSS